MLALGQRNVVVGIVEKSVTTGQAGQRIVTGKAAHFLLYMVYAQQQIYQEPGDRRCDQQGNAGSEYRGDLGMQCVALVVEQGYRGHGGGERSHYRDQGDNDHGV